MHPNPAFRDTVQAESLRFVRERAFGMLAVSGEGAPLLSHVPFLLSGDGAQVDLHLVRSNPIARTLTRGPLPARIAVSGADSYVSPDWYGIEDQVPTWNYVAVHLTGMLELRPQEELRGLIDRQSAFFEGRLAPKPAWTTAKMDPEALERLMRMIVPVRMTVEEVDGTWKLGQNKTTEVREEAAAHMDAYGFGAGPRVIAAMMRGV